MKLAEAIAKQVDIVCANEDEKAQVVEILGAGGVVCADWSKDRKSRMWVLLYDDNIYAHAHESVGGTTLPASQFIQANKG